MAIHLSDAVLRRLDLGTGGPPAAGDLEAVTERMADLCDWRDDRIRSERATLLERLQLGLPSGDAEVA
jgi:hypothetical protein